MIDTIGATIKQIEKKMLKNCIICKEQKHFLSLLLSLLLPVTTVHQISYFLFLFLQKVKHYGLNNQSL